MLKRFVVAAVLVVTPVAVASAVEPHELTVKCDSSTPDLGYRVPAAYRPEVLFMVKKIHDTIANLGLDDLVRIQLRYFECVPGGQLIVLKKVGTQTRTHQYMISIGGGLFEKYDPPVIEWLVVSTVCKMWNYSSGDAKELRGGRVSAAKRCTARVYGAEGLAAVYANERDIYACRETDIRDCYAKALALIQSWDREPRTG